MITTTRGQRAAAPSRAVILLVGVVLLTLFGYGVARAATAIACTAPVGHSRAELASNGTGAAGSGEVQLSVDVSCPPFSDVVSIDARIVVDAADFIRSVELRSSAPTDADRVLFTLWQGHAQSHGELFAGRLGAVGHNDVRARICAGHAYAAVTFVDRSAELRGAISPLGLGGKC